MANTIFLGLGSNKGDRETYLQEACRYLGEDMVIEKLSSLYETEPHGVNNHPTYLNQVLQGTTLLSPHELLSKTKTIEKFLGRDGKEELTPRVIDIDILFFNKNRIKSEELTIPHKKAHTRKFVLIPLVEIAPNFIHPYFNLTITEILERCQDEKKVTKL